MFSFVRASTERPSHAAARRRLAIRIREYAPLCLDAGLCWGETTEVRRGSPPRALYAAGPRGASVTLVPDHPAVERVKTHAAQHGLTIEVRRFAEGTRTAEDAARAIGCEVAQIVKSLVYVAGEGVVVVLVSGADRVDEAKLATTLGVASVRRATAKEVRERTGYVVGGVAPFGHAASTTVLVDRGLFAHTTVWAAAGLPDAVFAIQPDPLLRASGAATADLRVE